MSTQETVSSEYADSTAFVTYTFRELPLAGKLGQLAWWTMSLFFLLMALAIGFGILPHDEPNSSTGFVVGRWAFTLYMAMGSTLSFWCSWVMRMKRVHKLEKARIMLMREMKI